MSAGFVEGSILGVNAAYPTQEVNPVLVAIDNGVTSPTPDGVWTLLTVPNVPADIKAVYLCGLLIITNNSGSGQFQNYGALADLLVYFRAPGAPPSIPGWNIDFPGQACMAGFGGQRSGCSLWVPVVNGQFEWMWTRSTTAAEHPDVTYGCKFYVNAYLR